MTEQDQGGNHGLLPGGQPGPDPGTIPGICILATVTLGPSALSQGRRQPWTLLME